MEAVENQVAEGSQHPVLYLVPYNNAARQATAHPMNESLRYLMENGAYALYISFENPDKQVYTLGRAGCDIFLPDPRGADIAKHQCSFFNTERGAVLLEDNSSKKNTEPYSSKNGGQTIEFTKDTRRVLVARGINNMIGIGRDKYYQFEIHWDSDGLYDFPYKGQNYRTGPRNRAKYIEGDKVGGGSYGTVFWAMDVHTGGLIAVKRFHNLEGKHLEFATREITNMFRINRASSIHHDHIVEILGCAGGARGDNWGEIFMPLKEGNLKTLVLDKTKAVDVEEVAEIVLHQMLLALDCIADHNIVHRDLKPENILWEFNEEGAYHFRLGDFGLSNSPELAVTVAGTEPFMAPEVFHCRKQTGKVDIWSLFATIVWVKNVDNFRRHCAKERAETIHNWLAQISTMPHFQNIQRMASIRAKDRPSAKQLLRILGLSGDDGADELADSLANALTLDPTGDDEEDAGLGPSRRGRPHGNHIAEIDGEPPGVPYYETYIPDLKNYNLDSPDEEGEGSNAYEPPPMGESPRAEAWVKPYDEPYGPLDEGEQDSGTAGPDLWTARPQPTQDTDHLAAGQVQQSRDRKGGGKGKKKKGLWNV